MDFAKPDDYICYPCIFTPALLVKMSRHLPHCLRPTYIDMLCVPRKLEK